MTHMPTRFLKVATVLLAALATLLGLANSGTIATAGAIGETGKIYYLGDNSKQELFRTRPAPGAILPGEKNYDHTSEEVVDVRGDGTQVLKNAIIIHPDGSITLPALYHETPGEKGYWYQERFPGDPCTRWNDESEKWEIVYYGPFAMEPIYPDYYVQPYVDDEGIVHTPGNEDYHPELYGMWGFVPPVLRPEGYVPGEPWPEPLDWSKLDELTAEANGTSWDSTTVFDRWIDGTKVYGNGLIIHPNGVYHTPNDWSSVDENGTARYINVYFDEEAGEWSVYYTELAAPIEAEPSEPPVEAGDEVDETGDDAIWNMTPDAAEDVLDIEKPEKAEESSLTSEETEELAEPITVTLNEPEIDETLTDEDSDRADQIDDVVDTSEIVNSLSNIDLTEPSEEESSGLSEANATATEESLTSEPLAGEGQMMTIG